MKACDKWLDLLVKLIVKSCWTLILDKEGGWYQILQGNFYLKEISKDKLNVIMTLLECCRCRVCYLMKNIWEVFAVLNFPKGI